MRAVRDLISLPLNALRILASDNKSSTNWGGRLNFVGDGSDVRFSATLGNQDVVGSHSIDHSKKFDSVDTLGS